MGSKKKHVLKQAPLQKVVSVERVESDGPKDKITTKRPETHMPKILGYVFLGLVIGIGLLLAISLKHSFVTVSLAGHPISQNVNVTQLKNELQQSTVDYTITVKTPKTSNTYSLSKTGVSIDLDTSIENAILTKKPKNLLKRLAFWDKYDVPLDLTTNQKTIEKFVDKQLTVVLSKPKNATVKVTGGTSSIVNEKNGKGYSVADPQTTLLSHISYLNKGPITLEKSSLRAKVTKTEALKAKTIVDTYLKRKVNFDITGVVITASPADIGRWLEITPVTKNKTIDVEINSGKVLEYLDDIAAPYVSPPQNAIVLPGSSRVLITGSNGIDIVNKEALASEISKQMLKKSTINQTLSVQYQTYKTVTATPHDKWIAVDLTSKVLYAYENTKLVNTFLISGGAPGTPTVEGTYKIYSKIASQDMAGPNADGTRYFQPGVPYVNYFYADYAIHGVYWRPDSYLGNINASHGCVGMNVTQAGWLYNWAPVGTTVITFS
ncbi:MAG TPA: L,D-transpeptidase family protein [Candidatus Saccharibacteria bacterium]|nr:L,D-transpeptidase family protein [Candidatus Saccharibacteria bacterium]